MKTLKVQCFPAVVLLLVFFFAIRVHAQITPVGDSYTNSAAPTTNYGSKTLLDVDAASQITYIQFDLGSIPAGATVSQATLKLYVNSVTTAGSLSVDYVTASWSEGTIDASNAPPLGAAIASNVEVGASEKNHYLLINITPALVAWLNGSQTNDGIALVANGSFNATFDSKENTTTSHPPELDVVFAGGGGGTITGVLTGAGSGLVGGGTSGTLNLSLLNTCSANQVLEWNGSAWGCASAGMGTITGVTAGTALTGGGNSGNVTLNVDTTKVPLLAAANTFTGNQTVNGNLSATGMVTGSAFNIGSNLFAFGSYANENAFLGFAGNTTMTGTGNTAGGYGALAADTTGAFNTANGLGALLLNTTGGGNAAFGADALFSNTTGIYNSASGSGALFNNTTGGYNTATGEYALSSNTTASYSTANGSQALYSNTTGGYNTATGGLALGSNTTASNNTADGSWALYSNTTGGYDTAEGSFALFSNTTGHDNTANGFDALYSNTTGIYNIADGSYALGTNNTGAQNTAAGWSALYANTSGFNNVAYGWDSGNTLDNSSITGSNNTFVGSVSEMSTGSLTNATAIGAHAEVAESNALVLGSINGVNGATANTNVGIGTTTPAYTLDVEAPSGATPTVNFGSTSNPAALTVHGTGNFTGLIAFASGQTFPGTGTISGVTAGTDLTGGGSSGNVTLNVDTTKVVTGVVAGTDLTGGGTGGVLTLNLDTTRVPQLAAANTFTGNQTVNGNLSATGPVSGSAFQIGSNLFAFGSYANGNAFLGFAGNTGTTGSANTGSGYYALANNTSALYNTANGFAALYLDSTGGYNTASGAYALNNTSGVGNTASGFEALVIDTTGSNNTAMGYDSGLTADNSYITGSNSTFVGANTSVPTGTLSNATAIGAYTQVAKSNAMVLGSINGVNGCTSPCSDTQIGIGITAPTARLHIGNSGGTSFSSYLRVEGPATAASGIPAFSAGGYGTFGIDAYGAPNGRFIVLECRTSPCPVGQGSGYGLVGINTATPDETLSVNGYADKLGSGSWDTYSDGRLKNVDGNFQSGLDKVLNLRPVRYRYKEDNALGIADHEEHIGVVAQEVKRVLPEAVSENNRGYLLVNNDPIIWAMLNAIKEQQQEIKALRKRAVRLESKLAELQRERGHADLASAK